MGRCVSADSERFGCGGSITSSRRSARKPRFDILETGALFLKACTSVCLWMDFCKPDEAEAQERLLRDLDAEDTLSTWLGFEILPVFDSRSKTLRSIERAVKLHLGPKGFRKSDFAALCLDLYNQVKTIPLDHAGILHYAWTMPMECIDADMPTRAYQLFALEGFPLDGEEGPKLARVMEDIVNEGLSVRGIGRMNWMNSLIQGEGNVTENVQHTRLEIKALFDALRRGIFFDEQLNQVALHRDSSFIFESIASHSRTRSKHRKIHKPIRC